MVGIVLQVLQVDTGYVSEILFEKNRQGLS